MPQKQRATLLGLLKMKESISIGGNVITYVLAAIQTNEVLQIIEFVMSVVLTLVILAYRVWQWWKEAKKGPIRLEGCKRLR